ncbi:MAG TPA: c-type cytochrome biogenesis protein CcsB [Actinomycetota bacterium]|nr:c-type cytochrome biogenesis protein CcsB [Actinomycetota bacterium]
MNEGWARAAATTFDVALWVYLAAMVVSFAYLAARREALWTVARVLAVAGAVANLASIVARGLAAGRVPWGNMFEYSTVLAFLVVAGTLVLVEGVAKVRTITGFSLMFAVLTLAIAAMVFPVDPSPLQPALNSYWIRIHVVAAIVGSSLFAIGGIATILFLFKDRAERRALAALRERAPAPIMGGSIDVDAPHDLVADPEDAGVGRGPRRGGILPPAAVLDRIAYRTIAFGFFIWTFAVIAGAIWAQEAWGRYWGWDPKETWSFVTWTIFAGYLHARSTAGWRGRKAAWIAVAGFVSLLLTYYFVNLGSVSLHSYKLG